MTSQITNQNPPAFGLKQRLSEEEKRHQTNLTNEIEELAAANSKFISTGRWKDNETKLLQFLPEKTKTEVTRFESNPDKDVKRVRYYVYDMNEEPNPVDGIRNEKEMSVSLSTAKNIQKAIKKGYFVLAITRKGTGFDTEYEVDTEPEEE
jgi:hypothetical protein